MTPPNAQRRANELLKTRAGTNPVFSKRQKLSGSDSALFVREVHPSPHGVWADARLHLRFSTRTLVAVRSSPASVSKLMAQPRRSPQTSVRAAPPSIRTPNFRPQDESLGLVYSISTLRFELPQTMDIQLRGLPETFAMRRPRMRKNFEASGSPDSLPQSKGTVPFDSLPKIRSRPFSSQ